MQVNRYSLFLKHFTTTISYCKFLYTCQKLRIPIIWMQLHSILLSEEIPAPCISAWL